jgi:hypothetical protein
VPSFCDANRVVLAVEKTKGVWQCAQCGVARTQMLAVLGLNVKHRRFSAAWRHPSSADDHLLALGSFWCVGQVQQIDRQLFQELIT